MGPVRLRHYLLGITLLLGAVLLPALSQAAEVSVAVLGLDAVEVPEQAAQAVTEVLRRQIAAQPGIRVVPVAKELVEVKLIFGCMEEKPACLATAGRSLGADRLLYGSLRRPMGSGGYTVVLKQLDVRAGRVDRFISDIVPQRVFHAQSTELADLAHKWLSTILLTDLHGGLSITSDPPGAAVTLDGAPAGQTPLEQSEVLAGKHGVELSLPGYGQVVRSFEVRGGLVHHMQVVLPRRGPARADKTLPLLPSSNQAEHPPAETPRTEPADRGVPFRLSSYFLIGAAAISGGIALYTWRTYSGEEGPTRQALDMLQTNLPGASADLRDFFRNSDRASTCQPPAELTMKAVGSPLTQSLYNSYLEHCQRGRGFASATTGLVATMGSLALLGVISYIVGDRLSHGKRDPADAYRERRPGERASFFYKPRLRVVSPTVNAHGGGLDLSFQF